MEAHRLNPVGLLSLESVSFYEIWKKGSKKYMKNTNISCIGRDSVAFYSGKGMKLRRWEHPERRSILGKLRHWPPGTDKLPFVPSFFL